MIITDEEQLRVHCEPVALDEVDDLIQTLEHELSNSKIKGVGLAAPQIGIAKRAAIIRVPGKTPVSINLVNCNITKKYDSYLFSGEGCLSFPDKYIVSRRYREILVENNLIYPHRFIARELVAVVVQHELDHLDGILLPDIEVNNG